jgi:hypothetical protein
VLSWNETEVTAGRAAAPEEAKYIVLVNVNNEPKAFCCQLHAAEYFLPPGYEAKQKPVVELPKPAEEPTDRWAVPDREKTWMDEQLRYEIRPVNGISQPDGYAPEGEDDGGASQHDAD